MLIRLIIISLVIPLSSLSQDQTSGVTYYGSLRGLMSNDLGDKISLDSLRNTENLYALGAISGLQGEILVIDSKLSLAAVEEESLILSNSWDTKACLLVMTTVENWTSQPRPKTVSTDVALENYLLRFYQDTPLPFLIKGRVSSLKWHVIDWDQADHEHTHEKHKKSGLHGEVNNEDVTILGFYSDKHYGEFTHHSTNIHMHFITSDGTISGHVDDLVLSSSASLLTASTN
jgi:acetolactate decarboxylase